MAYLCNRFFDVTCVKLLEQRAKAKNDPAILFNNDTYALSELVQFFWRSNVRVQESDKPVYVWIPDQRMRALLQDFVTRGLKRTREGMLYHMRREMNVATPKAGETMARARRDEESLLRGYVRLRYFRLLS